MVLDPFRQLDICRGYFLREIAMTVEKFHARNKPGRNNVLILDENARLCFALETRDPRLDCPNRIHSAALKESQLIRICGWHHDHVTAGLRDVEALGF